MSEKIYADFNGIEPYEQDSRYSLLNLTSYGTLASLSENKIRFNEGMELTFFDPEGLIAKGTIIYVKERVSHNCSGWFAKVANDGIFDSEDCEFNYGDTDCRFFDDDGYQFIDDGSVYSVETISFEPDPGCGSNTCFDSFKPLIFIER